MKNSLKNGAKAQILGLAIFVLAGGMPAYGQSEAAEEGRTKLEEIAGGFDEDENGDFL